jgi:hypothetical protein
VIENMIEMIENMIEMIENMIAYAMYDILTFLTNSSPSFMTYLKMDGILEITIYVSRFWNARKPLFKW